MLIEFSPFLEGLLVNVRLCDIRPCAVPRRVEEHDVMKSLPSPETLASVNNPDTFTSTLFI
jgi:hypothetical protein